MFFISGPPWPAGYDRAPVRFLADVLDEPLLLLAFDDARVREDDERPLLEVERRLPFDDEAERLRPLAVDRLLAVGCEDRLVDDLRVLVVDRLLAVGDEDRLLDDLRARDDDDLRPPDELDPLRLAVDPPLRLVAERLRLEVDRLRPFDPPLRLDDERLLRAAVRCGCTSPSSITPRHSPLSSSSIRTYALKRAMSARTARFT
jgi:hypothetical protein